MTIRSTRPLLIAHHLIWTAYGWWLPNDPRGSTSTCIRSDVIADLGELHYGRKEIQPVGGEIRQFYRRAKACLQHDLLSFQTRQIERIAEAFGNVICTRNYTCYGCAILQDHVHILIRKHRDRAEQMIEALQDASRATIGGTARWPHQHPVWGGPGWKVFLHSPKDIRRTIRYINHNPIKHRLGTQRWSFVMPYDNWPLHPGHNPDSPYARRLRKNDAC